MLCNDTRRRWRADIVEAGHLGAGLLAGDDALSDLSPFSGIELPPSSTNAPLGPATAGSSIHCGASTRTVIRGR